MVRIWREQGPILGLSRSLCQTLKLRSETTPDPVTTKATRTPLNASHTRAEAQASDTLNANSSEPASSSP